MHMSANAFLNEPASCHTGWLVLNGGHSTMCTLRGQEEEQCTRHLESSQTYLSWSQHWIESASLYTDTCVAVIHATKHCVLYQAKSAL